MSRFLSDLNIERLPRKRGFWRVARPLLYLDSKGRTWEVLAGTETDGASIPRLFWRIIGHPLDWQYAEAAALHDFLYGTQLVCRAEADALFLEAMKSQGVSGWKRYAMWTAVRLFGKWSWNRAVWATILTLAMLAMACGCKSVVTELRDGKPWIVEEVTAWPFTLSHKEYPKPTPKERKVDNEIEFIDEWSDRGMWLFAFGGLVAALGVALALYSHVALVDKVALLVASLGAAGAAWGLVLVGITWHLGLVLWAVVCAAAVFIIWRVKKLMRERATP